MKTKLSIATALVAASMIIAFAAGKVETCADKYSHCSDVCTNAQAHCKAAGTDPGNCEIAHKTCMNKCDKAKQECEKAGKKS